MFSFPRGAVVKAPDVVEREDGNVRFKKGDFNGAVKCYTRSIALNPASVTAYSNRAMCYLKLNEHTKAVDDASVALSMDPRHVKSLLRRGTASNALGRHRAALRDFTAAQAIAPENKQAGVEVRKTKELRKFSVRRAPRRCIPVVVSTGHAASASLSATPDGARPVDVTSLD